MANIELNVCPSLLTEGYNTYSPKALIQLFDGIKISHILDFGTPTLPGDDAAEAIKNAGRLSLSGAQSKFGLVIDNNSLRYSSKGEQSSFILKPRPSGYQIINHDYCAANENLTMQLAAQVYGIETAANGLCFFNDGQSAYITRRFDVHSKGKYQQEDFASLMGLTKANGGSDYKYNNGSYEECAEIIRRYVKSSTIDILRFFRVVLFNFIVLNDDAHLKISVLSVMELNIISRLLTTLLIRHYRYMFHASSLLIKDYSKRECICLIHIIYQPRNSLN